MKKFLIGVGLYTLLALWLELGCDLEPLKMVGTMALIGLIHGIHNTLCGNMKEEI